MARYRRNNVRKHIPDQAVIKLKALSKICAKENGRIHITDVYLSQGYAYATDGVIAARMDLRLPAKKHLNGFISPAALRPSIGTFSINEQGEAVLTREPLEIVAPNSDMNFPDLEFDQMIARLLGKRNKLKVQLNVLLSAVQLLKAANVTYVELITGDSEDPILLSGVWSSTHPEFEGADRVLIMPLSSREN